jgi:hypothetical protein
MACARKSQQERTKVRPLITTIHPLSRTVSAFHFRQAPSRDGSEAQKYLQTRRDGEGRNRTGDTTIFSRVLYQLSYLAEERGWYRQSLKALR